MEEVKNYEDIYDLMSSKYGASMDQILEILSQFPSIDYYYKDLKVEEKLDLLALYNIPFDDIVSKRIKKINRQIQPNKKRPKFGRFLFSCF